MSARNLCSAGTVVVGVFVPLSRGPPATATRAGQSTLLPDDDVTLTVGGDLRLTPMTIVELASYGFI